MLVFNTALFNFSSRNRTRNTLGKRISGAGIKQKQLNPIRTVDSKRHGYVNVAAVKLKLNGLLYLHDLTLFFSIVW